MNDAAKPEETAPRFEVTTSRQFVSWLASTGASLAVTTYQSGKILMFGTKPAGEGLAIFERNLERPMGLAVSGRRLAVAALTQIITFVDAAEDRATGREAAGNGAAAEPFDAVYVPRSWRISPAISTRMIWPSTNAGGSSSSTRCSAASRG